MNLNQVLGQFDKCQFVADFYGRLPHSGRFDPALLELGSWQVLEGIVLDPAADVMIVRENARYEGPPPGTTEELARLAEEGHTLLVRHAERHHAGLAELARGVERDLGAAVNIHMYATPPGQFGFGWHYDAEEVFIVQCSGRKTYSLRKNTVNPWPLEETLPADMKYEREIMPLMQCRLTSGDWLYIPAGYWHKGSTAEEEGAAPPGDAPHGMAVSLAIGAMAPAAIGAIDALRARLANSILWRQRLPVAGEASPLSDEERAAQYRELAGLLAAELAKSAGDEALLAELLAAVGGAPQDSSNS